jgi:hypothetical protein
MRPFSMEAISRQPVCDAAQHFFRQNIATGHFTHSRKTLSWYGRFEFPCFRARTRETEWSPFPRTAGSPRMPEQEVHPVRRCASRPIHGEAGWISFPDRHRKDMARDPTRPRPPRIALRACIHGSPRGRHFPRPKAAPALNFRCTTPARYQLPKGRVAELRRIGSSGGVPPPNQRHPPAPGCGPDGPTRRDDPVALDDGHRQIGHCAVSCSAPILALIRCRFVGSVPACQSPPIVPVVSFPGGLDPAHPWY